MVKTQLDSFKFWLTRDAKTILEFQTCKNEDNHTFGKRGGEVWREWMFSKVQKQQI